MVLGVLTALAGLFCLSYRPEGWDRNTRGAVLFIGLIPIILGTDKGSTITVAVLAIVLIALAYIFINR